MKDLRENLLSTSWFLLKIFISLLVSFWVYLGSSNAGLYDDTETLPGSVIHNQAIISWGREGTSPHPFSVKNDVRVLPFNTIGKIRIFRKSLSEPNSEAIYFHKVKHATDVSNRTGLKASPGLTGPNIFLPNAVDVYEIDRVMPGVDLYFTFENAGLNFDSSVVERVFIDIKDEKTGDHEVIEAIETGPDSGVFSGYICTCADDTIIGDGRIQTRSGSKIEAIFFDPWRAGRRIDASVDVGPLNAKGVFFDSRTGAPVNEVEVTLIDVSTGVEAIVYGEDLSAQYPATILTGSAITDGSGKVYELAPGEYLYPYVASGSYRFEVRTPRGYIVPSTTSDEVIQNLDAGPFKLQEGSRLESFEMASGLDVGFDVPMDGSSLLDISRIGSSDALSVGDAIKYTVKVGANVSRDLVVDVHDVLPVGVKIDLASVTINGSSGTSRSKPSENGLQISFSDVYIKSGSRAEITYVAFVSMAASPGDRLESSSTAFEPGFISNTADHSLKVEDVFGSTKAMITGQVFANGCEAAYDRELDLSSIRVYTESGEFVETDESGQFSFREVNAGTHALHLDELSLPSGFEAVLCDNNTRRAGARSSIFADSRGGFSSQVYFYIKPAPDTTSIEPKKKSISRRFDINDINASWMDTSRSKVGVVYPTRGYLPRSKSLELAVMRKSSQSTTVVMNGNKVSALHQRPSVTGSSKDYVVDIWTGAALRTGNNIVEVVVRTKDGEIVFERSVSIGYNDVVENLEVLENLSDLTTNGRRQPQVVLRPTNSENIPLHPGTIVTVSVDAPFMFAGETVNDAPKARVTATADEDGLITLNMLPPRKSGAVVFTIDTEDEKVSASAYISVVDRPWMLIGLAEGTAANEYVAKHMKTFVSSEILSSESIKIFGRASLFAEGVIDGKWLATLRYDSAHSEAKDEFFAVDLEKQYVVYGDNSVQSDAAQSRHSLYLRLQSDKTDILYGDYNTDLTVGASDYSRKITGGSILHTDDDYSLQAFAAKTSQSFRKDSFPGDGTSGPFDLSERDIVSFSEELFIETSSRSDPNKIISVRQLTRGDDYDIDYKSGRVFLSEPMMSRDTQGNSNALIIKYEVDSTSEKGIIVGGRMTVSLSEDATIGFSGVHQDNIDGTDGSGKIYGADVDIDLSEDKTLQAGVALSHQGASDTLAHDASGHSFKATLLQNSKGSNFEIYVKSQDTNFGIDNQISNDDNEHIVSLGAVSDIVLSEHDADTGSDKESKRRHRLRTDATYEKNLSNDDQTARAEAVLLREEGASLRGAGIQIIHEDRVDQVSSQALKFVGTSQWSSSDERLSLGVSQELTAWSTEGFSDPDIGVVEARYKLTENINVKATNESAFTSDTAANIFSIGAEINGWKGSNINIGTLHAASEGDPIVIGYAGISQDIKINEAWKMNAGVEGQSAISGDDKGPVDLAGLSNPRISEGYTTFRLGFNRSVESWNFGAGIEHRLGDLNDSTRLAVKADGDFNEAASFGANASFYVGEEGSVDEVDHKVKASVAYRPKDSRTTAIQLFEARKESENDTPRTTILSSVYLSRETEDGNELNLRHGIKYSSFDFDGTKYDDVLNLIGAEYRLDVKEWMDIGIHGTAMHSLKTNAVRNSLGASVGFTPFQNGWISAGYNFQGYHDKDFSAQGYTDKGAFVQFRMKVDSDTLESILSK